MNDAINKIFKKRLEFFISVTPGDTIIVFLYFPAVLGNYDVKVICAYLDASGKPITIGRSKTGM